MVTSRVRTTTPPLAGRYSVADVGDRLVDLGIVKFAKSF